MLEPPAPQKSHFVLCLKIFFITEVCKLIDVETIRYAHSNFNVTIEELESFMAILLLSGYAPLPPRYMCWEYNENTHNAVVSSLCQGTNLTSL